MRRGGFYTRAPVPTLRGLPSDRSVAASSFSMARMAAPTERNSCGLEPIISRAMTELEACPSAQASTSCAKAAIVHHQPSSIRHAPLSHTAAIARRLWPARTRFRYAESLPPASKSVDYKVRFIRRVSKLCRQPCLRSPRPFRQLVARCIGRRIISIGSCVRARQSALPPPPRQYRHWRFARRTTLRGFVQAAPSACLPPVSAPSGLSARLASANNSASAFGVFKSSH